MKHHCRTLAVIGLCLSIAACSLMAAPLSAAAGKINVSFSIAAHRNAEGNDVILFVSHVPFCVAYAFQSYENGRPDSQYGDEIRAGKKAGFEAPTSDEGERSTMKFYRCGHYKTVLATARFVFVRGYRYSTPSRAARAK